MEEATLLDDSCAPDGTQRPTFLQLLSGESTAFTFTMQTHRTGAYTSFNFVPTARELRDELPTEETAHSITGAQSCLPTQDPRGISRLYSSGCQTLSAAPDHYPHLSSRPEEGKGNRIADNFLLVKGLCPQGPLPPHPHCTECVPCILLQERRKRTDFHLAVSLCCVESGLVSSEGAWSWVGPACCCPVLCLASKVKSEMSTEQLRHSRTEILPQDGTANG